MNPTPPPDPRSEDEVLSFLTRLERFLLRIIEGIGIFFVHRIPKWTYEVIRGLLENVWEYLERFVRIIVRLGRVTVLTGVLLVVVIGPGLLLYRANAPGAAQLAWVGLIVGAILFALQHYARKEYERRKRERAVRTGVRQVCSRCRTAHSGPVAPPMCQNCGAVWSGVEV
jgi:hypothetical protein